MSTSDLRQQLHQYIEQLSPESLNVAAQILAELAEPESQSASQELSNLLVIIPPLKKELAESQNSWKAIRERLGMKPNSLQHEQLPEILPQLKQYLQNLYGEKLDRIVLFGSQARGEARPDSDIDVLIVFKELFDYSQESQRINNFVTDLCLEYSVVISCIFTTSEEFQQHDSSFFRNVRREGVTV